MSPGTIWLVGTLAFLLLVPMAGLIAAFAPLRRSRLRRFALERRIVITTGNGALLVGYLTRTVRWRACGGAAGWILGAALPLSGRVYVWGAVGYLAGALLAEIRTSVRMPERGVRRAALTVRRSRDYLTVGARWGPVIVLAATAGQLIAYFRWPNANWEGLEPLEVAVGAGGVAVALAVFGASRWLITQRPRPGVASDVAAADDAIRSSSMQTIAGAALALMCLSAHSLMWATRPHFTAPGALDWIFSSITGGMFLVAIYAWFELRGRVGWRRRVSA
jgi:hypothetical protein